MRRPGVAGAMRALLVLLLLIAPVAAQHSEDAAFQVRGAFGDIPTTAATEADGQWNLAVAYTVEHQSGNDTVIDIPNPVGMSIIGRDATCAFGTSNPPGATRFTIAAAVESGPCTLSLLAMAPGEASAFTLALPSTAVASDAVVILYVPEGHDLRTGAAGSSLPGTGPYTIHRFDGAGTVVANWYVVAPFVPMTTTSEWSVDWQSVGLGVFVGIVLWGFLVSRGIVQKRQRKQVAATAAHVEAGKEGQKSLEARRRMLMAALKELEGAKTRGEVETDVYDRLKAEYKKQTVTVMRALEE